MVAMKIHSPLLSLKAKANDRFDSFLLFAFGAAKKTQILSIQGEEFEPANISGFDEDDATINGNILRLYWIFNGNTVRLALTRR
jgi:hypothetical protein